MHLIDIHQHILPAVDDGAQNMEQTIEMLRYAENEGIEGIIATPHFDQHEYRSEKTDLRDLVKQVNEKCGTERIPIRIYLGAEIYCEPGIFRRIASGEIPVLADSRYALLEFGYGEECSNIRKYIRRLAEEGVTAVIAHAERYINLRNERDLIYELKEDYHTLIQLNASAVIGEDGYWIKQFCKKLLREQLVDFIATDAHNVSSRAPKLKAAAGYVAKKYGDDYAEKIFLKNPQKIISDTRI